MATPLSMSSTKGTPNASWTTVAAQCTDIAETRCKLLEVPIDDLRP